jgi:creatinine amidohydrolase
MYELEALTTPALGRLLERDVTTVIVPFGSIEHHGGHLPLGTDALLADIVGREVAARVAAVLAPTVRVGCAEQHIHLAGTLTLRPETLSDVAVEIGESLARHGFRTIAFVSTHGGNTAPLRAAVGRLNKTLDGACACAPGGDVGSHPGSHSGEWLTSVMLALRPELVDLEAARGDVAAELRAANAERGAVHVERFVSAIVDGVHAGMAPAAPSRRSDRSE